MFLSARHLQLHLYYVVNSYSHFCLCCFAVNTPLLQVLLVVAISTSDHLIIFPFQYTVNQLKCGFCFCFFFYYSVWAQCAALISMLLFKLEKWLLYEIISWQPPVMDSIISCLNICIFLYFVRLCFLLVLLELTCFPYSLTSYPFEIFRYFYLFISTF